MSDIFPDRNIVDEINSNRGSSAEQKIQYRIMQALESIAADLHEFMHPPVPKMNIPEKIEQEIKEAEAEEERTRETDDKAHEERLSRRRRGVA